MNNLKIQLLQYENENVKPLFYHDKCDKYDYLIASGCGAIAGLVDIFLVGSPVDSALGKWTDAQVDKAVLSFAKTCGWTPRAEKKDSVSSAIGFLEKKFPVNYDHRHTADVGNALEMGTKNHHMKSLAHAPDILGLFFSILNQFTSTATFLSDGKLITIKTDTYELQGHNFISKLFCGIANWFGHIMSDIAGSSGSRKEDGGRGTGVVIPFFELFQLCDFGKFQVGKDRNTLAKVATKVFQEGYDERFGLAMAIPVILCDLSVKLIWALKRHFYHKRPLVECIPNKNHDDLRLMLLLGNGTLCLMDGVDAVVKSGGNWANFFLRLNIVAWFRLVSLSLREVGIRLGISFPLQKQLDAYIRINEALMFYMGELEKIDLEQFKKETIIYNEMVARFETIQTEEELTVLLKNEYKAIGLELPWKGKFDDFMNDKNTILEFN